LVQQAVDEAPLMVRVAATNNKLGSGMLNEQTLAEAETILSDARAQEDRVSSFEILKSLSRMSYGLQDFEASAAYAREALDIVPNAVDVINDLTFVLAKHLDRMDEAVPLAERALASNPSDANILDTIGFVFLESGRLDDAIRTLNRAAAAARNESQSVPANVHLAQAYLRSGDRTSAQEHLNRARRALPQASPIVQNSYTADIRQLESSLASGG